LLGVLVSTAESIETAVEAKPVPVRTREGYALAPLATAALSGLGVALVLQRERPELARLLAENLPAPSGLIREVVAGVEAALALTGGEGADGPGDRGSVDDAGLTVPLRDLLPRHPN